MWLNHDDHKHLCAQDNIRESNVEFWEMMYNSIFMVMQKKEMSDDSWKQAITQLESTENMCHTHVIV